MAFDLRLDPGTRELTGGFVFGKDEVLRFNPRAREGRDCPGRQA